MLKDAHLWIFGTGENTKAGIGAHAIGSSFIFLNKLHNENAQWEPDLQQWFILAYSAPLGALHLEWPVFPMKKMPLPSEVASLRPVRRSVPINGG